MKIAICDDDALCREQVPDLGNAYIQQKNQDITVSVYDRSAALVDAAQRLVGYDIYTPDFFLGDPYVFMAISRLILCPAVQQSGLLHHFLNSIIEIRDASALDASLIFAGLKLYTQPIFHSDSDSSPTPAECTSPSAT